LKTTIKSLTATDYVAIGIATSGGAGFIPRGPGTAGAVVGLLAYLAMDWMQMGAWYLHAIIFFLIAGTWAASRVEGIYGHDSQRIVVDEVVGQMITFAAAAGRTPLSAFNVLLGFGLFRLFDIVKPFPLRRLERIPNGVGVIADDVGAGLYASVVLTLWRDLVNWQGWSF
jgi:phosphatidylglycerophosphatase A